MSFVKIFEKLTFNPQKIVKIVNTKNMFNINTLVCLNKRVAPNIFFLKLKAPRIARAAKPGQFVEVKVSSALDPLLRRPLSIHGVCADTIEVLYAVVGKATAILSNLKAGDECSVMGPLGNGFILNKQTLGRRALCAWPHPTR